jgi:hypothetical protein
MVSQSSGSAEEQLLIPHELVSSLPVLGALSLRSGLEISADTVYFSLGIYLTKLFPLHDTLREK